MKMPQGRGVVWYWFAAGSKFLPSYYFQQLHFLLDAFRGSEFKGALIRVSVSGGGQNIRE